MAVCWVVPMVDYSVDGLVGNLVGWTAEQWVALKAVLLAVWKAVVKVDLWA